MYEYAPNSDKKLEKLIFLGLLILGALFYGGSMLPNMPFPAVLQLVAFAAFAVAIVVVSKLILCRYVYRAEPRNVTDYMGEGLDLVIAEHCGKRIRTLLRIELTAIRSMTLVTKENKRELAKKCKGKSTFRYAPDLRAENRYLLEILHNEELIYVYILSDETLKNLILQY